MNATRTSSHRYHTLEGVGAVVRAGSWAMQCTMMPVHGVCGSSVAFKALTTLIDSGDGGSGG